ncbi:co-chaperone GroES [candidate division WWE3 bacterium RIFCSPLOWO2_12_FULL_36_10]|uniref:Co-chaperonin GroES n=1 Tax=candidate division WWE3 bacterium RIFCSPLOWO2_12_FULL_36_10 TaxID=1802630 RepID=A0A1F4VJ06_UNCKA|nr:MAG: co-chaperone GroES [candidate division WWE3 bacterium RIFCSPLOWO2_12_FULL_36_10]
MTKTSSTAKEKIKPLADYLMIEPLEQETTLPSGIILPDTAKEKPQKGRIIATGKGKKNEKGEIVSLEVKVGDVVMYKKWGGTEVKLDGKEYLLVREEDVLAIVEA